MSKVHENKVEVLFNGYSYKDSIIESCIRANCTCTLVKTWNGLNIIIDTMTAWDGGAIVEALARQNLTPSEITTVVCTHGHSDHIGCNYLFGNAQHHFVGSCVSHHDKYFEWANDVPYQLLEGDEIVVQRTPGHTNVCVSVIVKNTSLGTVGICGDLFEREEDIANPSIWLEAGSENEGEQRKNRHHIASVCDYIVPGHGPGFIVTQEMRQMLSNQAEVS